MAVFSAEVNAAAREEAVEGGQKRPPREPGPVLGPQGEDPEVLGVDHVGVEGPQDGPEPPLDPQVGEDDVPFPGCGHPNDPEPAGEGELERRCVLPRAEEEHLVGLRHRPGELVGHPPHPSPRFGAGERGYDQDPHRPPPLMGEE